MTAHEYKGPVTRIGNRHVTIIHRNGVDNLILPSTPVRLMLPPGGSVNPWDEDSMVIAPLVGPSSKAGWTAYLIGSHAYMFPEKQGVAPLAVTCPSIEEAREKVFKISADSGILTIEMTVDEQRTWRDETYMVRWIITYTVDEDGNVTEASRIRGYEPKYIKR